jgi:hypothetical protein
VQKTGEPVGRMTQFLGWYLAAVLAAYSLSASWALGIASDRVVAAERQVAQLSADVEDTRARLGALVMAERCARSVDLCASEL